MAFQNPLDVKVQLHLTSSHCLSCASRMLVVLVASTPVLKRYSSEMARIRNHGPLVIMNLPTEMKDKKKAFLHVRENFIRVI